MNQSFFHMHVDKRGIRKFEILRSRLWRKGNHDRQHLNKVDPPVQLAGWKSANRFDLHSFEMTVDRAALVRNSDFLENAKSFHEQSYDSKFLYHSDL